MVKKYFLVLSAILFLAMLSSAVYAAFSISTGDAEKTVCIGSTAVIVDKISGDSGQYTTEASGTATAFSTTVPTEFSLRGSQNVYSYITPSSKVAPGDYVLTVKITSGDIVKEQIHTLQIKNCHGTSLTVDSEKKACPCEEVKYSIVLENLGEFTENFDITVEGTAKEWTNLSETNIELESGERGEFYAYVNPPCKISGDYNLEFKAIAKESLAGATAKTKLTILPCYEYSLELESNYSICENEKLIIPLKIINKGTADNTFAITLDAPNWAELASKSIDIDAESEKTVEITARPPFKTKGNFTFKIETMTTSGDVSKKAETSIDVKKCYGAELSFENEEDKFCGEEKTYNILIKNLGEFEANYDLSIDGPEWATLEDKSIKLDAKENKTIELKAAPEGAEFKEYTITLTATDSESGETASDTLKIEISKPEDCYKSELTAEQDSVNVEIEKPFTLFLMLKNKGLDEASYKISLEGKGAKFSLINPENIKLGSNESETIYLYISPPLFTETGEYNITVTAEEEGSKIASSKAVTINVLKEGEKAPEKTNETAVEETKEQEPNIFIKIIAAIKTFFKKLFMVQPVGNDTVEVKTNVTASNASKIEISSEAEEVNETAAESETEDNETADEEEETTIEISENETAEINDTEEAEDLGTEDNETITDEEGINETTDINITDTSDNETASITGDAISEENETSNETVSADNETISGEDEDADETEAEDNEAASDENETATANNETEGTNETLDNKTITEKANETEKVKELSDKVANMDNFLASYKSYIIGAGAIVLIILIIISGIGKSIVEFFEEEEPKNNKK